ncbi:MAG: rRNA ((1939)-C(5))-methyltransferase RlmD [Verrucomicrobiota bacterium]|jgi:cyclopropane fatty-acyl-phospholipid synthase-like methyltransferase
MNKPWWHDFYDEALEAILLDAASDEDNVKQARALMSLLGLKPGARVLDQCCGNGRLSLPLARLGCEVLGVDLAAGYIAKAEARARSEGLNARFEVQDALEWYASPPRQAVINMWTSFGYSDQDEINRLMLQRAFDSLEPGGLFLLDTLNLPGVLHHFRERVENRVSTPAGELHLERLTRLDWDRGLMLKDWIYTLPDGSRQVKHSSTRLYLPHSICALLRSCGFVDLKIHGELDGSPLSMDSLRLIIVARRPL